MPLLRMFLHYHYYSRKFYATMMMSVENSNTGYIVSKSQISIPSRIDSPVEVMQRFPNRVWEVRSWHFEEFANNWIIVWPNQTKNWQNFSHLKVCSTVQTRAQTSGCRADYILSQGQILNLPVSCLPAWSPSLPPFLVLLSATLVQSDCVNSALPNSIIRWQIKQNWS